MRVVDWTMTFTATTAMIPDQTQTNPHVLSQRRKETHVSIVDTENARHMFAIDEVDFTRAEI